MDHCSPSSLIIIRFKNKQKLCCGSDSRMDILISFKPVQIMIDRSEITQTEQAK